MSVPHPSLAIPLSPSSPPESGLKQRKRRLSDDTPNSPASPPLMSIAAKSDASNYNESSRSAATSDPSQSQSTSTSYQAHSSSPIMTTTNSLPTPANSVAGSMKEGQPEDGDQHRNKRQRMDNEESADSGLEHGSLTNTPLRTDHDRDGAGFMDTASRDSGKIDESGSSGQLRGSSASFFLRKTALATSRSRPHPSQHLLSLYGLGPILRSVARTNPSTGEKINTLRKSYSGQIKNFELAGKNKPVAKEIKPDRSGRLMTIYRGNLMAAADIRPFDVTNELTDKLQRAMQMQPGVVRNKALWDDVLGHEKPRALPPPVPATQSSPPVRQQNGINRPLPRPELKRPTRTGTIRSYQDSSFEGYQGFPDDELDHGQGRSSDDEDGGPPSKRRRGH